jgi:hypothetical protein
MSPSSGTERTSPPRLSLSNTFPGRRRLNLRNRDAPTIYATPPGVRKAIMVRTKSFKWLIALSVAAGLLTAPLSVPAMAVSQGAAVSDEMAADMPCCPDQQDQKKDCGSCPFVALCTLTIILLSPDGNGALIDRMVSRDAFAWPDDLLIDGLGEHPPDHPPRTIV